MEKPNEKTKFVISVDSKVYCLNVDCVNNIQNTCNLKGVSVDETGVCAGITKIKIKKKK